jgi:hypothetical protein
MDLHMETGVLVGVRLGRKTPMMIPTGKLLYKTKR